MVESKSGKHQCIPRVSKEAVHSCICITVAVAISPKVVVGVVDEEEEKEEDHLGPPTPTL